MASAVYDLLRNWRIEMSEEDAIKAAKQAEINSNASNGIWISTKGASKPLPDLPYPYLFNIIEKLKRDGFNVPVELTAELDSRIAMEESND